MTTASRSLTRRGSFWASAAVLALCLWASGAPSVLYPSYAAEWHLTSVVVTTVFAAYPVVLLIVLIVFGSISDVIGRRNAMLIGVGLILVSSIAFVFATDVAWLYVGRVLQGAGAGFAIGAASAALVENNTSKNPRLASALTAASTAFGLTLALLVSGVLAQYAPLPQQLSYIVLIVLTAVVFVLVYRMPRAASATHERWRPQRISVPRDVRRVFAVSALSVTLAFSVGALFLSLGASIARDLTGTSNLLVVGGLLAVSAIMIGATAIAAQRLHSHIAVLLGAVLTIAGLVLLELSAGTASLPLFLLWCIVGGAGYSLAFTGGLALLAKTTRPEHRGATLSAVYLVSYLGQALTAVVAGVLATSLTLGSAVDIISPIVGVLAVVVCILAAVDWRLRMRVAALPA